MKPKKLIRESITEKLKEGEWEIITDQDELNQLYAMKVREELVEIQASGHKDIMEFADLIQVAFSFAKQNGFTHDQLAVALIEKAIEKGFFGRWALNNLNPYNPSNKLYFENVTIMTDTKNLMTSASNSDSNGYLEIFKTGDRVRCGDNIGFVYKITSQAVHVKYDSGYYHKFFWIPKHDKQTPLSKLTRCR